MGVSGSVSAGYSGVGSLGVLVGTSFWSVGLGFERDLRKLVEERIHVYPLPYSFTSNLEWDSILTPRL